MNMHERRQTCCQCSPNGRGQEGQEGEERGGSSLSRPLLRPRHPTGSCDSKEANSLSVSGRCRYANATAEQVAKGSKNLSGPVYGGMENATHIIHRRKDVRRRHRRPVENDYTAVFRRYSGKERLHIWSTPCEKWKFLVNPGTTLQIVFKLSSRAKASS